MKNNLLSVRLQQSNDIVLDLDFQCQPDELLAIVGPSGSGKTTVLRMIAGLASAAQGSIHLGDEVWFDSDQGIQLAAQKRGIGMVFQGYTLFPHLTALQNIALALPQGESLDQAHALLNDMGLSDLGHRYPAELSGGQCQRVALARAFARRPKVLLLDEPFSAVDRPTRFALYEALSRLRERICIPILMVTHDLTEASMLSDRMLILDEGQSLQSDSPENIFSRPKNARVAALVGLRNIYSGVFIKSFESSISRSADSPAFAEIRWGEGMNQISLAVMDYGLIDNQSAVKWVISEAHIHLHTQPPITYSGQSEFKNFIACSILKIHQLGAVATLSCSIHQFDQELMHLDIASRWIKQQGLEEGSIVYLELDPAGIHLMPADLKTSQII